MSALTDLFTAMANKIRSKTGTATTYTPAEMVSDGIDDVFDAGAASVPSPTSITPSNVSPVGLTANSPVNPSVNGYAIESYSSATPSNSSPASLSDGGIYKMNGGGYAIGTQVIDVTPSVASPGALFPNTICRPTAAGYAISEFTNIRPSDSNPPSVQTNTMYRMMDSGYVYKTQWSTGKIGAYGTPSDLVGNKVTETIQTGLSTIDKFILRCNGSNGNNTLTVLIYDANVSTTQFEVFYYNTTTSANHAFEDIGASNMHLNTWTPGILSISGGNVELETGANAAAAIKNATWFAVGN